jgi:penicillin-insensitive murein endopeptidase
MRPTAPASAQRACLRGWALFVAATGLLLAPPSSSAQERRPGRRVAVTAEAQPRPARRQAASRSERPPRGRATPSRPSPSRAAARRRTRPGRRPSERPDEPEGEVVPGTSASRSIGTTSRGRLRRGVALTSTPHLVVRNRRANVFGIDELVGALQRAAARVAEQHSGPRLLVGDLSSERGGRLSPHRSHRSGRDADVSFYLNDAEGRPAEVPRFVNLRRDGCGELGGARYCFDAARNFALVAALLEDPTARVQYVMVAPDLRDRLLAEGARREARADVIERIRVATAPHSGSRSHRSHFHVRVYCPVDDRPDCVDEPPYHSWYQGRPAPRLGSAARRRAEERRRAELRRRRRAGR